MKYLKFLAAAAAVLVFSSTGFAQDVVPAKFVSIDGGFRIDMPSRVDESIRPIGSMSAGAGSFSWRVREGDFTVGFVEGISVPPNEGFAKLNDLAATVDETLARSGAKLIEKCEFSFDGYPGIELRVERPGGIRAINRFILAGRRLYILTADFPAAENEAVPRKILDSFEITDSKALIA
jgi:hypothetical protein